MKGAQEAYIKAANNDANDEFGEQLAISGDTIVVAAIYEDSNETTITNGAGASADDSNLNAGAVYVYTRSGVNWAQEAYIKAANNDANDYFGYSVALEDDTLVVGSEREASTQSTITNGTTASADDTGSAGAAYVYKRDGTNWAQEAYIKPANTSSGNVSRFGSEVAISGNVIVVGAYAEQSNQTTITNGTTASTDNSNASSGAAYVYRRIGTNWQPEAYIKAANNDASDQFGISAAISGDTIIVGANGEDSNETTITNGTTASADDSVSGSGAVYIYRNN